MNSMKQDGSVNRSPVYYSFINVDDALFPTGFENAIN